jgi:microcystin-dependent protein
MSTPIGAIAPYSFNQDVTLQKPLEIWKVCDGAMQARFPEGGSKKAPLFAVIGTIFGLGDGSKTYALPDLRGYFVRSPDTSPNVVGAAGLDPGPRSQTQTPDGVGSTESDCVGPHAHDLSNTWGASTDSCSYRAYFKATSPSSTPPPYPAMTEPAGGTESRPINAAFSFIILAGGAPTSPPIGSIMSYGGVADPDITLSAPDVWLICDGRTVTAEDYPDFCAMFGIGAAGPIPDFRGAFLRGAPSTTDVLGSYVPDQLVEHLHSLSGFAQIAHDGGSSQQIMGAPGNGDSAGTTDSVGPGLGPETRPVNMALHQIIRVA